MTSVSGIDLNVTREGATPPQCFCPQMGLVPGASLEFREQLRDLLRNRLRISAVIMFGGLAAFFLRNVLGWAENAEYVSAARLPLLVVTVFEGCLVVFLCRRCRPSLLKLRTVEVLLFGLPAILFAHVQFLESAYGHNVDADVDGLQLIAASVPWIVLLQVYGLFIPNTWRRATAVVALMAIGPAVTALLIHWDAPDRWRAIVSSGALSYNLLLMAIVAVIAIWSSHRFGMLRREAFDLKSVGVYTLLRRLGSGGMGEVYLAEHQLLKRPCAVKLIRPDRAGDSVSIARFRNEVQATARLTHPNTVEIYDYGLTDDGTFFYVMEYLPGLSLQDIVDRTGPMPAGRVIHLLRQVCSALAEAHRNELIHRDLKPGNIFAAERGGIHDFAKLLDFGLVKSTGEEEDDLRTTREGVVLGSPLYAAPEATVGNAPVDARADIYSLGATAYFLLTGRPVFSGERALQIVFAHAKDPPVPPSRLRTGVPEDLEAVILRCLAKSPDDRYDTAEELDFALTSCSDANGWSQYAARRWWQNSIDFSARGPESVDQFAVTAVVNALAT